MIVYTVGKGEEKRHKCTCDRCKAEFTIRDDTLRKRRHTQTYQPGDRCRYCQRVYFKDCPTCGTEFEGHLKKELCDKCKRKKVQIADREKKKAKRPFNPVAPKSPWEPDRPVEGPGMYEAGKRHAGIDTNSVLFAPLG